MSHITTITHHNNPGQRDMLLTTHEPLPLDPSKDRNKGFARCCFLFGKWFCDPFCSNSAHRVIPLPPCPLPPYPLPPCPVVLLPPAPLPLPPSPPPPRKNKCPTRRSLRTSATPPLFSLDPEPTLAETNKRKRREKKGCKCILHTEYDVCQYCPAVGCTHCSWINHDLTSHLRPTKKPLIVWYDILYKTTSQSSNIKKRIFFSEYFPGIFSAEKMTKTDSMTRCKPYSILQFRMDLMCYNCFFAKFRVYKSKIDFWDSSARLRGRTREISQKSSYSTLNPYGTAKCYKVCIWSCYLFWSSFQPKKFQENIHFFKMFFIANKDR